MGKAFENLLKKYEDVKKEKHDQRIINKADKVRSYLYRIQMECEFKTVDDYEKFMEISLELIDEVKKN